MIGLIWSSITRYVCVTVAIFPAREVILGRSVTTLTKFEPTPLHRVMTNEMTMNRPACGLCGDRENGIYACRACEVRACGCCDGTCEGCGDLVCSECADTGPPLDPGCPRCVPTETVTRSPIFCVNQPPNVATDRTPAIL